MHVSYISLAFFAVGAIAAPAAPKPSNDFGDITGGFPFNPTGPSSIEDSDEGFGNSFPSALDAMHQALAEKQQSAEAAQHASTSHTAVPKPTHAVQNFPAPVVSQASSLSQATPVASQAPVISKAASTTAIPTPSHGVIPTPKGSSASPSSSATPSPSATAPAGPLSGLVNGIPIVGGLVHGPLAGLGLRR
ncbi:uncharacterized protein N7518_000729 [Penicillium psychrosexuale]|uniref:uncharacterized protein n=1 Tax=Penicillium psychrosexuale TaxID=1002107 RepID=UPI0025458F19|nr:uncharacterized protein N7518_000729 [Penicillium psychrosexuale]KAJ5804426.1 hypothetical protein N7518_000729 [Penicillium psychrosexuale]